MPLNARMLALYYGGWESSTGCSQELLFGGLSEGELNSILSDLNNITKVCIIGKNTKA